MQEQLWPPTMLKHRAFSSQLWSPLRHSSCSGDKHTHTLQMSDRLFFFPHITYQVSKKQKTTENDFCNGENSSYKLRKKKEQGHPADNLFCCERKRFEPQSGRKMTRSLNSCEPDNKISVGQTAFSLSPITLCSKMFCLNMCNQKKDFFFCSS